MDHEFHSHPVFYEEQGHSYLQGFIDFHTHTSTRVIVLCDHNTRRHCLPLLRDKLQDPDAIQVIEMPAGEGHKNLQTCQQVWQELIDGYADRQAILINLGGGVVTDLGGFAASVYKRGIRFIHMPTSLLGMTDAAIGGKTAVDLRMLKNMIGLFAQPLAVFIEPRFIYTLPERELKNGFAEMLKHGLISEPDYFNELASQGPFSITSEQIRLSVEIKSAIVIRDPFEKNHRKSLNFGHTIGHALESYSLEHDSDPLLHGEAVIIGMIGETLLSQRTGLMKDDEADRIINALLPYLPEYTITPQAIEASLLLMQHDKKNAGSQPGFTLLRHAGRPVNDQQADQEMVREIMEEII
ncbi:MAG: 3-dehydroquinate synthase [Bacteroidales bacterium]